MERLERLSAAVLDPAPQLEISIPGAEPVHGICVCILGVCWHSISCPEGRMGAAWQLEALLGKELGALLGKGPFPLYNILKEGLVEGWISQEQVSGWGEQQTMLLCSSCAL